MKPSLSKREVNCQRWRNRISAWKKSGQSQKAFCADHHLRLASFQRWHRIFKAEAAESVTAQPAPVGFLPVRVRENKHPSLSIVVQDDLRIEVTAGFNPHLLQQVIEVLRAS